MTNTIFRITMMCKHADPTLPSIVTAENVRSSFKCPACGDALVYLQKERRLGAHGKSASNLGHELRRVEELKLQKEG